MHKYIWKILFIFFVINSLYIRAEKDDDNKNKGDDPCLHNIAMCSNKKLSKNKLSFIYDIWKNYETYKDIITNHQNKEMNKTFQLQDEAEDIKLMNHSLSMPMSFQFSTHTIILFKFWETLTVECGKIVAENNRYKCFKKQIVLGLSFGYFLFGNNFITCNNKTSASDMNVHKEFYGDPACCGC
ncbi:copper transporter [Plasmodium malariae]|uniref:Copper transporter n=1 Tax=Plasmodium malariae TaxID=5858 RepID=A0A1A8W7N0_PLAMA|nr:copper transporter [Plasmodium malariae]